MSKAEEPLGANASSAQASAASEAGRSRLQSPGPEDFYMENGFVVFTAAYHLRRGYCCNSGCRHCPYREPE